MSKGSERRDNLVRYQSDQPLSHQTEHFGNNELGLICFKAQIWGKIQQIEADLILERFLGLSPRRKR